MIQYDKFQKSLINLKEQHDNYLELGHDVERLMREAVSESVIQRYEVSYDYMWKVLKRYLSKELGIPEPPNSPKPLLRCAFENGVIPPPMERWLDYADARTGTSHDYSGEKARRSLALMPSFISDAEALYEKMTGKRLHE